MAANEETPIACSACFSDRGLRLDAEQIGQKIDGRCPNCGAPDHKKLPLAGLQALAHRFFVWGSLLKMRYGAAPLVQFNEHQQTSIDVAPWLAPDVRLFERLLMSLAEYTNRSSLEGQACVAKKTERQRRVLTQAAAPRAERRMQRRQVRSAHVGEFPALEIAPDLFDGVQFGRVAR